jgi:hypothetical protein
MTILDETRRLLLQAAFGEGEQAVAAYRGWRSRVALDDIDFGAFRVLGQLVRTASRLDVGDPEIGRIRGALKHTWLNNMMRSRALAAALTTIEQAGIDAMVIKGAALFARFPDLAKVHSAADFDILVREPAAMKTMVLLAASGFRAPAHLRFDLFQPEDFAKIHAIALTNETLGGSVDLHWWPLPHWTHQGFVDELFARSETSSVGGQKVRIPALADHLYLALGRPEAWEGDEVFARAVEVTHIVRESRGSLDWARIVYLCRRFHRARMAEAVLSLIKQEIGVPVPDTVLARLRRPSLISRIEFAIGHAPPRQRSAGHRLMQEVITQARSDPRVSPSTFLTAAAFVSVRRSRRALVEAVQERLPQRSAESIWRNWRKAAWRLTGSKPRYLIGFSYPEQEGRWTDGYSAVAAIPAPLASDAVGMSLTFVPMLASADDTSTFEVCAGAGLTKRVTSVGTGIFPATIEFDAELIETPNFRGAIVALNVLNPRRPYDLGLSEDIRLLGVFVRSLGLCDSKSD